MDGSQSKSAAAALPESVLATTAAEAFLLTLRSRGIKNFFVNGGTDFAPLVEAYARLRDVGEGALPAIRLAAHENLAMGMAHGAYLMTGAPQAVMVHVNVGTANAACATINAAAERVPILLCAGRTPVFEHTKLGARNTRITWAQEMYDQASMLRGVVKWDYELRSPDHLEDVIDRALGVAQSGVKGPVYLTLPREALAEALPAPKTIMPRPCASYASAPAPNAASVAILADRLISAELPVIASIASGADQSSVSALAHLCEAYAIGYAEDQARYLNLPSSHPMHLGFALPPVLREADALCFVESDVPWVYETGAPRDDAFVAQCGVDPAHEHLPIRSHRADLMIATGAAQLFDALAGALEQRKHRIDPSRRQRIAEKAIAGRAARAAAGATELDRNGPITNLCLSATLARVISEDCVLLNEYWVARGQFAFDKPGSYFYLPASAGLGWALPAAIGAKLASPEKTFVAAVGDGTYMFSNPAACHHAARKHDAPVLTVICNNARWNAVNTSALRVYPQGEMSKHHSHAISDLSPSPDFEQYAVASGGFGIRVSERGELEAALRRALHAVQAERRQAVVNVICA